VVAKPDAALMCGVFGVNELKVGDLVRFRQQPDPATGVIVNIDKFGRLGILWSFLNGQIGYNHRGDVEIISASR